MKEDKTDNSYPDNTGPKKYRYDFDRVIDRRNTNSLKWELRHPDELPMWVADMDFAVCPEIKEAIISRAQHGIFGYSIIPEEWYKAYSSWWEKRHSYRPPENSLVFCTGVVPALSSLVRKLTTPAEKVLIQTPVYNIFYNSIINQGRFVLESPLVCRDDGSYEIDFDRLEKDLSDPQCTMMFLCNPHNPVGKIWSREDLARIGELCHRHGVTVVADEIHCDLTVPGREYIPFASVNETCADISVSCWAPSKTFNIAGLNTAAVMIPNPRLRYRAERGLNTDECAEPNAFAVQAAVAAFTHGAVWLDELRDYLYENARMVFSRIEKELPSVTVTRHEATYLLWINVSAITEGSDRLGAFLRRKYHLRLSSGTQYGPGGEKFLRLNIACPKALLKEGLNRFIAGCLDFTEDKKSSDSGRSN